MVRGSRAVASRRPSRSLGGSETRSGGPKIFTYGADQKHGNPVVTAPKSRGAKAASAGGFSSKPSSRMQNKQGFAKVADLGKSKANTNFARDYHAGNIPFCIDHGSINSKLKWKVEPEDLDYDPLFITCLEGIREVQHPYVFMVRTAVVDLMYIQTGDGGTLPRPHAVEKVRALMGSDQHATKIVGAIRQALMLKDEGVTLFALRAVQMLAEQAGPLMNKWLSKLVPQIHKKSFSRVFQDPVTETFQKLEEFGGKPALQQIKTRVPTYNTIFM